MNNTLMINVSKLNPVIDECLLPSKEYSIGCLTRTLCPQINQHLVKVGIFLVCAYVIYSYISDWFFTKGYKKLPFYKTDSRFSKFIGNIHNESTRIYWIHWLRSRWIALFIGYIVMSIYFSY